MSDLTENQMLYFKILKILIHLHQLRRLDLYLEGYTCKDVFDIKEDMFDTQSPNMECRTPNRDSV